MYIHSNLKHLRALRKYSAQFVADTIGAKRSTLSAWENGQSEPNCTYLLKLSAYYRISVDMLLGEDLEYLLPSNIEQRQRAFERSPALPTDN
jgi:transcriptional regulator with XRE-family HTH domain